MKSQARLVIAIVVVGGWITGWLWFTRYYQLDDAFIHLRYAEYLRDRGFLTFDGIHPSFGCTSLLFVGILSILKGLGEPAFMAKALSILSYLGLLMAIFLSGRRFPRGVRPLWIALLATLMSPMAFRWLCDGMETSGAVLVSAIVALESYSISEKPTSPGRYLFLLVMGTGAVLLRVDLSLVIAVASLAAWLFCTELRSGTSEGRSRPREFLEVAIRESHLAVGGVLGLGATYYLTGYLLPDTAVAKAAGHADLHLFIDIARAFLASMSLGVGLLTIWVVSLFLLLRAVPFRRIHWRSTLVANSPLCILILATVIRGQYVHGVRYYLWAVTFTNVWNLLALSKGEFQPGFRGGLLTSSKMPRTLVWASISIVLVCAWLVEGHFLRRTFTDASKTFLSMRAEHLESLAGKTGVGFDIGAISYFTKGQICDVPGLVIGREAARWNVEQRAEYCMAQSPQFAYLDPSQAEGLARWGDLNSWLVCQEFPDSNVGTRRMHYLLLRPDQAGLCPKPPFPSLKEYLQQGGR